MNKYAALIWLLPVSMLCAEDLPTQHTVQPSVSSSSAGAEQQSQEPAVSPTQTSVSAAPEPSNPEFPAAAPKKIGTAEELPEGGLPNSFPEGIVSASPSDIRFKAEPGWRADGAIQENKRDGEGMLSQGDSVEVRIDAKGDVYPGDQYLILRKSVPTDADDDQKAVYLADIGLLEIQSRVSGHIYRAMILRSNDAVQLGDLIKRRE